MTNEQSKELKLKLIERVVTLIKEDFDMGYVEAVEELLTFCPTKNLVGFLPEEEWAEWEQLEKWNS